MTTAGNFAFTAAGLGFSVTNGDQSFSQYVQFTADAGVDILGLAFTNSPKINAFEVANFSVDPRPFPSRRPHVLMLAGLGAVGFMKPPPPQGLSLATHPPARAFQAAPVFFSGFETFQAGPPFLPA